MSKASSAADREHARRRKELQMEQAERKQEQPSAPPYRYSLAGLEEPQWLVEQAVDVLRELGAHATSTCAARVRALVSNLATALREAQMDRDDARAWSERQGAAMIEIVEAWRAAHPGQDGRMAEIAPWIVERLDEEKRRADAAVQALHDIQARPSVIGDALAAHRPDAHKHLPIERSYAILAEVFADVQESHSVLSNRGHVLGNRLPERIALLCERAEAGEADRRAMRAIRAAIRDIEAGE